MAIRKGKVYYQIKWKGYEADQATWQKFEQCVNAKDKIRAYHKEKELYCHKCDFLGASQRAVALHRIRTGHTKLIG